MNRRLLPLLCMLVSILCANRARGQVTFVDLGLPPGAAESFGDAINNGGRVAVSTQTQPYLRAPDGTWIPAGLPPGFGYGRLARLNEAGTAVGQVAATRTGTPESERAVIRSAAGIYTLPLPQDRSSANGINLLGEVVGATISPSPQRAYVYRPGVGVSFIPNPPGASSASANAINNAGVIVGEAGTGVVIRGFRHTPATGSQLLPTFGNEPSGAMDVNDAGIIAGSIGGNGTSIKAVYWRPDNSIVQLGPTGAFFSVPLAINAIGDLVGFSDQRAFLWAADFGPRDLNTLLSPEQREHWFLYNAFDINDNRQIVGVGRFDPDGPGGPQLAHNRAFLMNLPEPAMGAVLLSLVLLARRTRAPRCYCHC